MSKSDKNSLLIKSIGKDVLLWKAFNLFNELEKGRQIIKVIITEIMKDDQGENFNRSLAVYFPEVTVSRKIDTTGDNVLWTFKINYKTL